MLSEQGINGDVEKQK